jgi:uncharacterized membrane protein AbrB (regulator of aidB expression)
VKRFALVALIVAVVFGVSYWLFATITGRQLPDWALVLPLMVIGTDIGWSVARRKLRR